MDYENRKILIETRGLTKTYGSSTGATAALKGIDLKIYEGELLVILGHSGSGKSTLLNMIGGMDRPTCGSILCRGQDIARFNDRKLTDYRRKEIGFVFQSFNLIRELSAWENVTLTASPSADQAYIEGLFDVVELADKRNKFPSQLSGGEQQRVSIARALAKRTSLLLCDEPTGALDYETGKQVLAYLEKLVRQHGMTVVIVTHTAEQARMADRVLTMKNGVIASETVNPSPITAEEMEW